jgi:lysophospholipid acyltransferase
MLDGVVAAWDDVVRATSVAIAMPRGSTRFLLALALAPAIGLGFPALDRALRVAGVERDDARARARSAYALVTGTMLSAAAFGRATVVCAHFGACAYATMLATRRRCGYVVFAGSFAYLMRYHLVADTATAWKSGEVDISGLLMVLVLKVTACALNYQDAATTKASEMSEFQNRRHLKRLPSALDYASWLMFPCTLVSGPAIEFRDYSDWLRDRGVYARGTPNRVAPATRKLLGAIACLGIYQAVAMRYTIENTYLNPSWAQYSLAERIWHVYVYGQGNRAKYYFVWMMADFAATVSGLGFSGYDAMGKARWDTAANIYPIGVEKSVTLNAIPLSWNVKTGLWLRHYVYDRVTPKGKKPGLLQILITQIVSGVWHGLHAGYWLFFVSSAFAVNAGRLMYRWKQTRVPEKYRVLVDVPLWAFTHVALNYMCAAFILVDLKQCIQSWSSMHYFGHVGIAVLLVFGAVFAPRRSSKPKSA